MSTGHEILGSAIIDKISDSVPDREAFANNQKVEESDDEDSLEKKYTGVDSHGNLSEGYLDLATIPPETNICGDVDDDGCFRFLPTLLNVAGAGKQTRNYCLKGKYFASLMLTQACFELKLGKFFYWPMDEDFPRARMMQGDSGEKISRLYHCLPELVYIPFHWDQGDCTIWQEMGHDDRLRVLNARAGGIRRQDCVMPIDLVLDQIPRETIRLSAFKDHASASQAVIAIVPKAYVGWYSELLEGASDGGFKKNDWSDGHKALYNANEKTLEKYQLRSPQAIVERIHSMYGNGKAHSVVILQELIDRVIEFERESASAGPRRTMPDYARA